MILVSGAGKRKGAAAIPAPRRFKSYVYDNGFYTWTGKPLFLLEQKLAGIPECQDIPT